LATLEIFKDTEKKKQLEAEQEVLAALNKDFQDPGPMWDVIAFHDGEVCTARISRPQINFDKDMSFPGRRLILLKICLGTYTLGATYLYLSYKVWRAAVDTSEKGYLETAPLLTNYRLGIALLPVA
jgi:cell division protein FtsB